MSNDSAEIWAVRPSSHSLFDESMSIPTRCDRIDVTPCSTTSSSYHSLHTCDDCTVPGTQKSWVKGKLLGKGSCGRVYLAHDVSSGQKIAVKQVEKPRHTRDRNEQRQRRALEVLRQEIKLLQFLSHPNVVRYVGFNETCSTLNLFLDYITGGSMGDYIRDNGRLDDDDTRFCLNQIVCGLTYIHSNGILHRDLKADNILLTESGTCKISDFGISKYIGDVNVDQARTAMQGTVFWMCPEVLSTSACGYNAKADIWSLGCLALEMWSGKRPWAGIDAISVIIKMYVNKESPPLPPDLTLSPLADEFRQMCLAIRPVDRPTSVELSHHPYIVLSAGWSFKGLRRESLEQEPLDIQSSLSFLNAIPLCPKECGHQSAAVDSPSRETTVKWKRGWRKVNDSRRSAGRRGKDHIDGKMPI